MNFVQARKPPLLQAIPHLCGMPKHRRNRRWLMVLRAFFDECGLNPKTDRFLVVGGFLASAEEWEKASDAWDECLRQHPAISYFKSHEAAILDGEFGQFSRASADRKVRSLAQVIASFDLRGFCAHVPHDDLVHRDARAAKGVVGTRPYDWGFIRAIGGVLNYRAKTLGGDDKVDFIFDEKQELRSCIEMFDAQRDSGLLEMMKWAGQCIPGNDAEIVALQMADLLAGAFWNWLTSEDEQSEILDIIDARNDIQSLSASLPPAIPARLYLQGIGKQLQDEISSLLKRIHRDRENSVALLNDIADVYNRKVLYESQWNFINQMNQPSEDARKFLNYYKNRKRTK